MIADFYLYLNEIRALSQEYLIEANTIEDVKRLQGSIITIDSILNFTKQEEEETNIQNEYLGGLNNGPDESIQQKRATIN